MSLFHLRGLHTGAGGEPPKITVERVRVEGVAALLRTYLGGRRVLVFRTG